MKSKRSRFEAKSHNALTTNSQSFFFFATLKLHPAAAVIYNSKYMAFIAIQEQYVALFVESQVKSNLNVTFFGSQDGKKSVIV